MSMIKFENSRSNNEENRTRYHQYMSKSGILPNKKNNENKYEDLNNDILLLKNNYIIKVSVSLIIRDI